MVKYSGCYLWYCVANHLALSNLPNVVLIQCLFSERLTGLVLDDVPDVTLSEEGQRLKLHKVLRAANQVCWSLLNEADLGKVAYFGNVQIINGGK